MNYTLCDNPLTATTDCLILGNFKDNPDYAAILGTFQQDKLFTAAVGSSITFYKLPGVAAKILLVVGCGAQEDYNDTIFFKVLQHCSAALAQLNIHDAVICLPPPPHCSASWQLQQSILMLEHCSYAFAQFKSTPTPPPILRDIHVVIANVAAEAAAATIQQAQAIAAGVKLCRDLGNLPANICTPTYLANIAVQLAQQLPQLTTQVLEEADMEQLGMGALLSVAKGSEQRAKLVVINYHGAVASQAPIALVGKGITFDSGGISLKPSDKMDEMKYDMCGAASVLGTLQAAAQLRLPLNIVGIIACAENLPSGQASKPGDIVTTHAGKTVEILNTDAEGRLILCDALSYVAKFNPRMVLDIATLTGAMIIALGHHLTGIMGNDAELIQSLLQAGNDSADKAWQLPLVPEYQEALDSNFADMANVGSDRAAGSIIAACFLARFTKKYRWAHLDIAGTAWISGKKKGATGRPIPLLVQFLINQCN